MADDHPDPSVYITGIVGQLVALPLGKALEFILPTYRFRIFGKTFSLNPGPFNIKEHVLITVMGNISVQGAYATEISAAQRLFYNQVPPMGYQILLCLGSQIIGFSLGGLLRQFVVWPASMIWPGALVRLLYSPVSTRAYCFQRSTLHCSIPCIAIMAKPRATT